MADSDNKISYPVVKALTEYLADTAVVYFKTHGFHWNVEGENFYSLHLMFEKFYTELWESMDEVAERIRALGEKTPSSYRVLLQHAALKESDSAPRADSMVRILKDDYQSLAKKAREVGEIAKNKGDPVTENMMVEKATFLEKAAWMLHSSLID